MEFSLAMYNSVIMMPFQKPTKAVFEASQVRKGLHIRIDHTAPFSSVKMVRKMVSPKYGSLHFSFHYALKLSVTVLATLPMRN